MPWNRKDYPDDWEEIRKRILLRANNKCENCGINNQEVICKSDRKPPSSQQWDMFWTLVKSDYSRVQARKRMGFTLIVLTIAHLDHDKSNHEVKDDRLAAWCQACHLSHDKPRHVENRKYGRDYRKNQTSLF